MTTGFPARARLTVRNTGGAPIAAPIVGWATASDPDFALLQNTCEAEIAPNESCELRIQVVPSRAGALHGALDVQGATGVAVSALGMAAGDLILAPAAGSFEDFGGVPVGALREGTFTVSNPGSVSSGPLQLGVNRPEFALAVPAPGECVAGATALEPGQSCNLRLALSPLVRGPLDATLTIVSAAAGSVSLTLAGRGLVPGLLEASAPGLDFEGVLLTQSARRGVTLTNGGDEPLELAGASLEPAGIEGFTIANSDCAAATVLDAGQSCSVDVEFRPPSVGLEMTAELVASDAAAAQPLRIPLRGIGLQPGSLEVAPVTAGEEDFGDVLLGQSVERVFQIANPGAQPSGVLEWTISEGFEVVAPPSPGECEAGISSLVDGQTCTLRLRFTPPRREASSGTLTVSSPLAGAIAFALSGRGVIAGQVATDPEVNFGRVLTAATAERSLTLSNVGDQPLSPPAIELSGTDPAQVAAFTAQSGCTLALAPNEECTVTLRFAPAVAVPHAATMRLTSEGSTPTSVLLLGEALVPGSLVLAAAAESSTEFGDVALGTSQSRSFTLTNPGAVASGPLTITTDNNQFAVELGDCAAGDLVDGSSCTFDVSFTPTESALAAGNVSVQSPGAGRAGIAISGRGRRQAALAATGNRDLGRANIGQAELTVPENEFTWTVNNTGDLATGALAVANDNAPEFAIGNDTCQNAVLAGQTSCAMTIRFRPATTGPRTARITVSDPAGMLSAPIALTGLGVQLAAPGQPCINAECQMGSTCTRAGVCCDTACDRSCEACSAAGVCTPQSGREPCGNGAACFGVDQCKLPEGAACSAVGGEAQCGSGACVPRLGGAGDGDRICCLDSCAPGLACNAQALCEQPTAGDGAICGRPGDLPCGANLVCKACVGDGTGQSQCKPAAACCGNCGAGLECVNGSSCGCPVGPNGQRGIPCAAGCAINQDNACCPEAPDCDPGEVCDGSDNLCKQCLTAANCTNARPGSVPTCNQGTCSYPCGGLTPQECSDGRCLGAAECCQDCQGRGCSDGVCNPPQCTGTQRRCTATGLSQVCTPNGVFSEGDACLNGDVCNPDTGACEAPPRAPRPFGSACGDDGVCDEGTCTGAVCCETCTDVCTTCHPITGRCDAVPDVEPGCPGVTCPGAGVDCKTAGTLSAGSCRALGICKTADDCSAPVDAPRGTPCGAAEDVCDDAGNCTPTVFCGSSSCTIDADTTCCYRSSGATEDTPVEPICTSRAGCIQGTDFFRASRVECDSINDCRSAAGEVCCYTSATTSSISCLTTCQSSPVSSAQSICNNSGVPVGFDTARFPGFVCNN